MNLFLISIFILISIILVTRTFQETREGATCKKKYLYYHPPIRDKLDRRKIDVHKLGCNNTRFSYYFI